MGHNKKRIIGVGLTASLCLATIPAIISATGIDGQVQLNTEVSTSLAQ